MKTYPLTPSEQQRISNLAREIRMSGFAELDKDRIREDFHGLYSDIIQELGENFNDKIVKFYEFAELMDDVAKLTTPEMAYGYGRTAKKDGVDPKQGFTDFMREVNTAVTESESAKQRDILFYELCEALGDTRSLISEYVSLHARVNVEAYYINRFFELGYSAVTPTSPQEESKEKMEVVNGEYIWKDKNGNITGRCGGWA